MLEFTDITWCSSAVTLYIRTTSEKTNFLQFKYFIKYFSSIGVEGPSFIPEVVNIS